jgi:tetratricopeptide (TPR) repeat protein
MEGTFAGRLIARDSELERLAKAVARARAGNPSLHLVEGEAGVGKTRLVAEAVKAYLGPDDVVAFGHGVELAGGELPFALIADVLRDLTRREGVEAMRSASGGMVNSLAALVPDLAAEDTPDLDRASIFRAFVHLLRSLASDRFLWLAIEDLHWSDAASRDLVSYLIRVIGPSRLLITCTVRSMDEPVDRSSFTSFLAEFVRSPRVSRCVLAPLDGHETMEHLEQLLGKSADARLLSRVLALSQGVPFLIEELMAAGLEATGPVPASVRDLMAARLGRLSAPTQRLVECASLADGHLTHRNLAYACQLSANDLELACREAVAARVLVLEQHETDVGYRFRHALLREAIASMVLPAERMLQNERWATRLEAEATANSDPVAHIEAARHWAGSGDPVRAFDSAVQAGAVANSIGAFHEVAALLRRLLRLWPQVPEPATRAGRPREDVVFELVYALTMMQAHEESIDLLNLELRRPDLGEDAVLRLALSLERYWQMLRIGQEDDASLMDDTDDLIDTLLQAPPRKCVVKALVLLGWLLYHVLPDESYRLHEHACHLAQRLPNVDDRLFATNQFGTHLAGIGRADEAMAMFADILPEARTTFSPATLQTEASHAWCLNGLGRYNEAIDVTERALRRIGSIDLAGGAWIQLVEPLCEAHIALGEWDTAARKLREVEAIQPVRLWSNNLLGKLLSDMGQSDQADQIARRAWRQLQPGESRGPMRARVWIRGLSAHLAAVRREVRHVRELVRPLWAMRGLETESDEAWKVVLCAIRAEADAATRASSQRPADSAEAPEHVEELRQLVERLHRVGAVDDACSAQFEAEVARWSGDADPEMWNTVIQAWTELHRPHEQAWAALHNADCLITAGDRAAAKEHLQAAIVLAQDLNATPLLSEITALAKRARLDTRLTHHDQKYTGVLSRLTEREIEVLRHVAIASGAARPSRRHVATVDPPRECKRLRKRKPLAR